jgi:aminoglycoside phosphotransferase (APT) family kinase protein
MNCPGFVAPKPLLNDTLFGARYTVESYVEGVPYTRLSDRQIQSGARQVFDLLVDLKAVGDPQHPLRTAREVWQTAVTEPLRMMAAQLVDTTSRKQAEVLLDHAHDGPAAALPVAFTHGDLWWGNILLKPWQGALGLIDWDRWAEEDIATHDLLHFICYRRALSTNREWSEAFRGWLDGTPPDPLEEHATRRFAERLALSDGWKPWAGLAYWVREVTGHGPLKLQLDSTWVRAAVTAVLPTLLKQMLLARRDSS